MSSSIILPPSQTQKNKKNDATKDKSNSFGNIED